MAEKNYTKFDNDFFSHLSTFNLTGNEFRVLLFLIRQSSCYKRQFTKDCSYSFIAKGTGIGERQVARAIKSLIENGYISICNVASGKRSYSYNLRVDKLGRMGGQKWSHRVDKEVHSNIPKMSTKEITEDNSKEITEKREASPTSVYQFCTSEMLKMDCETVLKYVSLLPPELREKDPDDMTDSEWDIYDEWRCSNGLI